MERLPYKLARWVEGSPEDIRALQLPFSAKFVHDQIGHYAVLFPSKWDAEYTERENPAVRFSSVRTTSLPSDDPRRASMAR